MIMNNELENEYRDKGFLYIAGTDEVGRGPLAGPLVAAAVVFPPLFFNEEINDSKQISKKKRELLYNLIIENALDYQIEIISPETIDQINIYSATQLAMSNAINRLNAPIDIVFSDAMKLPSLQFGVNPIIKGDAKSLAIAAASILAKVTRDNIMEELDKKYPQYGFSTHKGYGTKKHLEALNMFGPIKGVHRYSYAPVSELLSEKISLF